MIEIKAFSVAPATSIGITGSLWQSVHVAPDSSKAPKSNEHEVNIHLSPEFMAGVRLTDEASLVRSAEYTGLHGREEFNAAGLHVRDLILSAYTLLKAGFHGPSLFLSITSLEELAKVKAGHTRSWGTGATDVKRGKDPLFSHPDKHKIALDSIALLGKRVEASLGRERILEIIRAYADGRHSWLRETALYFSRDQKSLKLPSVEISAAMAAEHLLIALEVFYEYFIGWTAEVSVACNELDQLYSQVDELYKSSCKIANIQR